MRIEGIRMLSGPNVYHHRPVLVTRLNLEALTETHSADIPGFTERLLLVLPGLREHTCSRGYAGGFVERLEAGTYFGHIVEHVAIELSNMAGMEVNYGKTRYAGRPGLYDVAVRCPNEAGMRHLVEIAVDLTNAIVRGDDFPLQAELRRARDLVADTALGPSTAAIVDAARRRGIPWIRLDEQSLVQLGYGVHRKFIRAAMTEQTSAIGVDAACDKELTKSLLQRAYLPVPAGEVVRSEEALLDAMVRLAGPVVVKPLDGNQGKGVTIGVTTPDQARLAWRYASAISPEVIVEEQLDGSDFRVLVVGGKMVAAAERTPCHVVGDGVHTIAELVAIANENPLRGEGHEKPLTRIPIDTITHAYLQKHGYTIDDVPAPGERVFLRQNANLSTGGSARDVTDVLHPDLVACAERAARVLGMDLCGVDLILQDPTLPLSAQKAGIIEVNASPGLRMHLFPTEGLGRDVGGAIVDMLYPHSSNGRIPVLSITGTNGKTTVTRLIGHVIGTSGAHVGMTTTDGIWIGNRQIASGDLTGPASARAVLSDPVVEVAVLETARGGIVRRGLGYDWADVGVLTNIQADHIGQDGIEDLEDLLRIKSLVAERVREHGTLVVNAEDPILMQMLRHPRITEMQHRIMLFALDAKAPALKAHLRAGGTAFYLREDGWIAETSAGRTYPLLKAETLPITFGGTVGYQTDNVLAAIAACRAHGLSRGQIVPALRSFRSHLHNPGRTNLFRLGEGYVLLDYGHNQDAFNSVCEAAHRWAHGREVIGIVGVPGDRCDEVLIQSAEAAARGFSRLILREDKDRRGRAPGEIPELLRLSALRVRPNLPCRVILDEQEALREVQDEVRDGAVAVLFYEHLEPLERLLHDLDGQPVEAPEGAVIPQEAPKWRATRVPLPQLGAGEGLPSSTDRPPVKGEG